MFTGCLFTFAAPFGCIMTGCIIDKYGRKPSLVMCIVPTIIGWLLLWKNDGNIARLFLGRSLTGFSCGATFFPAQVYLVEYIELIPSLAYLRTAFGNCVPSVTFFGYALVFALGINFSYKIVAFITFLLALLALFCLVIFLPESPAWLFKNGKYGDAEWAQKRLKLLHNSFENYPSNNEREARTDHILSTLFRRDVYIPLTITSATWALIMLSGASVFSTYIENIINKADSYSLQTSLYLCLVSALLSFSSNIIQIFVVTITGVRKLAIFNSLVLALLLSCYALISDRIADDASSSTDFYRNLSLAVIWAITFIHGFGFITIPRAILAELFPVDAKKFAAVPTITMYVVQTVTIKVHPYLSTQLGGFIFVIYAMFSAILAVFSYYFLPETVGKTMKQISGEFDKKEIPWQRDCDI